MAFRTPTVPAKPPANRPTRSKAAPAQMQAVLAAQGCRACPLDKAKLQSPKMLPTGPKRADVYILGEAPGKNEDEEGVQFVGKTGQILRSALPRGWEDKIRWNNTTRCRPPANRDPAPLEIACCRQLQEADIEATKPKVIIAAGAVPLHWFTGQDKITPWRGRLVPVKIGKHRCWVMPTFHPSYIARRRNVKNSEHLEDVFERDLATAIDLVDSIEPPDIENPKDADEGVHLLPCDLEAVLRVLSAASKWPEYAIDIETNGLRPYANKAKILSVAISNYDITYCIPLRHRQATWTVPQLQKLDVALTNFLASGRPAIAHNSKFEQEWFAFFYGDSVVHECDWQDTMSQAYILDEREGAKSLEALTILHLGMNVKALSRVNVSMLDSEPLEKVLRYMAYDAKYTYPLYWIQDDLLTREGLEGTYRMHNRRVGPFALAQKAGVLPDTEYAAKLSKGYSAKLVEIDAAMMKNKDVAKFVAKEGQFNPASNPQLKRFFYDQLRFKQVKKKDGGFSTDESILATIDHPVASLLLDRRGYQKLDSTYVKPLMKGGKNIWDDGLVHTNYNHARTSTGRLSSDEPNLQNLPIRTHKEVRGIFGAPANYWMLSCDYGQIEARVIAMASKDRFLVNALWENYDIHMEWAERISRAYPRAVGGKKFFKDKAVMKEFRQEAKNKWTFPLFFGSAMHSVATNLEIPERTIRPLYDEFWDTFSDVKVWQEKTRKSFRRLGYVSCLTGRRRHAPLAGGEIINSSIQGTASDIVVEAGNVLSEQAYAKDKPQWQFRLNVHDDLGFYIPNDTLEDDVGHIAKTMCTVRHDFVNVPITVEVKVGKNWAEQEEMGTFSSVQFGHVRNV